MKPVFDSIETKERETSQRVINSSTMLTRAAVNTVINDESQVPSFQDMALNSLTEVLKHNFGVN